jgi:cytochrome c oxidase subunit I
MAATDIAVPSGHEGPKQGVDFFHASSGVRNWLITLDHKRIGLMYLASVMFAFGLGGTFALLVRLELLTPGKTIVDAKTYNQFFTLHGAIMVFLFIIPAIPAALGNFILPIQLGAKDVAFPRLNLLSFYVYIAGALLAVYSIISGSIDTGWTFYTPYSTESDTSVLPMVAGVFIMGFSSILTGLNFIVTIHKLRSPGLTWGRLSLFLWSLYATSVIQVLATPVLAITLAMLFLEKAVGVGIFDPKLGGDPILFQHFFWFYSHPAVYIMILPGMGIISELIATFARKKIFGYKAVAMSSIGLALVSFIVWGHHLFVSGQSEFATIAFSFLTFLVAIPSAIKVVNWTMTLYQGKIDLQTPMLYALAFIWMFTIGGLTGVFLGLLSIDVHLHDTYFVVAHFHYVMMGGTVMGFLGGLLYWWPKMTGRMFNEKLMRISFALVFIGFNATFFVQFIMGARGMPRRYYNYLDQFQPFHAFSTVGSWILGCGFLFMLYLLIQSLRTGEKAPANPWHSLGLEWQTPSPPPLENFDKQPVVTHGPYDYHLAKTELGPPAPSSAQRSKRGPLHGRGGEAFPPFYFLENRPSWHRAPPPKRRTATTNTDTTSTLTAGTRMIPTWPTTSTRRISSSSLPSWGCGSSSSPRSSCSAGSSPRSFSTRDCTMRSSYRPTTSSTASWAAPTRCCC